jgi:hypothetical protein
MVLAGDVLYVVGLARSDQIDPEPLHVVIVVLIAAGALGLLSAPLIRTREAAIFVLVASSLVLLVFGILFGPFGLPILIGVALALVTTDWAKEAR